MFHIQKKKNIYFLIKKNQFFALYHIDFLKNGPYIRYTIESTNIQRMIFLVFPTGIHSDKKLHLTELNP